MSNIEPTEEHYDASRAFVAKQIDDYYEVRHNDLARLLAEREAKLREEVTRLEALCTEEARLIVERDTLRARVAELEEEASNLRARVALVCIERDNLEESEAQHLAGIKALHQFLGDHEEEEGIWIPRSEFKDVPCRKYLAHYDDAKAAEGVDRLTKGET